MLLKGGPRPASPQDYFHLGPVYLSKRLCAALIALFSVAAITICGPPWDLFFGMVFAPPAYHWDDPALALHSGLARVLDDAGMVRYEGEIAEGACTGAGKVFDDAGRLVYKGPLVNGVYEGADGCAYDNGQLVYEGAFAGGLYEGQGRLTDHSSNIISEGIFSAGVLNGEGSQYTASGLPVREGIFSAGLLQGQGREYASSGVLAREGTFSGGKLEGAGRAYTASGTLLYEGMFHNGLYDGAGALYHAETGALICQGAFSRGRSDGVCTLYNTLGQAYYNGTVLDERPRAAAFLGLSLAEVEQAFATHAVIYTGAGMTAFAFPAQKLLFATDSRVPLVSPAAQDGAQMEQEMLLSAADDLQLADDAKKEDLIICEVLSVGEAMPGLPVPAEDSEAARRAPGWREWYASLLSGEPLDGAFARQAGPFVFAVTPAAGGKPVDVHAAAQDGVRTYTVYTKSKDAAVRYQSAVWEVKT